MNKINVKRLFIILIILISSVTMSHAQKTYVNADSTMAYTVDNDTLWVDEIGNEGDGYIISERSTTVINDTISGYVYGECSTPFNDTTDITISFDIDKRTYTGIFRINGENVFVKRVYNYKMK